MQVSPDLASYEKLGTISLLIAAVVILWRRLTEKDKIIESTIRILECSTEASEQMAEALKKLREEIYRRRSRPVKPGSKPQ